MSNKYAEYLAFARLASWLDFPVGVLEQEESRVYTLAIKFPMGVITRRIPAGFMYGHWQRVVINIDEKVMDFSRAESLLLDLARSSLVRQIEIHKSYKKETQDAAQSKR